MQHVCFGGIDLKEEKYYKHIIDRKL